MQRTTHFNKLHYYAREKPSSKIEDPGADCSGVGAETMLRVSKSSVEGNLRTKHRCEVKSAGLR